MPDAIAVQFIAWPKRFLCVEWFGGISVANVIFVELFSVNSFRTLQNDVRDPIFLPKIIIACGVVYRYQMIEWVVIANELTDAVYIFGCEVKTAFHVGFWTAYHEQHMPVGGQTCDCVADISFLPGGVFGVVRLAA